MRKLKNSAWNGDGRRFGMAALCALALLAASACSGTSNQTSVPGAVNTGTYPNLNIAPTAATTPMSAGEKAALAGRISAAQNAQAAAGRGVGPKANPVLLRKLAAQHGKEALEEIEKQEP